MAKESQSTAVVDIQAELAKQAELLANKVQAPGGDRITLTKDKKFKMPNGDKNPGPLTAVIVDFVSQNLFYDRPWKEGEATPPACFAISPGPKNMVPSKNSPRKQSDDCDGCPNNEFESAQNGKGKACNNIRLLALVEPNDDENAPMLLLRVPPGSIKAFDAYASTIKTQFNTVPVGVVTDIYFNPNVEHQALLFGNPSPNKNVKVHFGRMKAALERLLTEPDVSGYKPPEEKKPRNKK